MKRLNVKLLAIVAIVFVVLTGGVVVVHGIQMRRNIDSLLKRAETAKENDESRNALVLYQRYRSYRPNDLERGAVLASLLADKAKITFLSPDYGAAHAAMIQVLSGMEQRPELKSEMLDLQRKLIDLNIAFREYGQARDDLKKLRDKKLQNKEQSDPELDLKLAQCYINTVEYGKARELLESLVGYVKENENDPKSFKNGKATAPHEIDAYSTLAILLREKMRDEDAPDRILVADKVVDQMVAVNPESARAFLSQAEYLAKYQSRDNAKPAVEKALQLAPDDDEVLVHAAELALNSNDLDSAETYSKRGIDKYPKDWRFYRLWTQVAEAQKKPEEARKRLETGLEAMPANIYLLDLSFDQQIRARFQSCGSDAEKAHVCTAAVGISRLRGRAVAGRGRENAGSQPIVGAVTTAPGKIPQLSRMVDELLVQCYATLNQPDRLAAAAKRIPNTAAGQMGLAIAEQALGQPTSAKKRYELIIKALEENKQAANVPQLLIPMYQMQVAEQLRKPKEERDWKTVEASLAKLREQGTVKEPSGTLMYVNLLTAKDEIPQARHELAELMKKYPGDVGVLVRAIQFALQEKNADLATRIINFVPAEVRQHPLLIAGRIETVLIGGKKPDEIKVLLGEIAKESEKLPAADRVQVDINLGMAYLRIGDNTLARQYWDHAAELDSHNANIRLMQFNLARLTGDLEKMKELEAWFEKEPNTDPAQVKLLQASVLVGTVRHAERAQLTSGTQATTIVLDETDKKNLARAKSLLRDVENMRPNWVEQPKLMADIDILEGRHDDSIEQLRKAMTVAQPTGEVVKQLAALLYVRHRYAEAEDVLVTNSAQVAGDPDANRLLSAVYLMNGKPQAALEKVKNDFNPDSTDANVHLAHGQMLFGADKLEEAEAAFRKVTELAPERPDGWLELVRVLVKEKKNEEARRTAQAAQTKLPEERRGLVLAQSYEMIGDTAQAEKAYQSAVAAAPNSLSPQQQIAAFYVRTGRTDQAKQYLNKIMASVPQTPVDKDCYAWARRMTAELLAGDGKYSQFLQAMEMLSPADGKASAEDLYLRIALLFRRSDPNSSRQALRLLEDLKKIRSLTSGERLNLAQLYERVGDWPGARAEMQALLSEPNPDPSVYITYIKMQLRRGTAGAADEASNWMNSLQSSLKASDTKITPEIAFLAARVASMQGRGPQAAAILIAGLISSQRPLPDEDWSKVALLAGSGDSPGYLEQLGQSEAAEKLLRENLGGESKKNILLAGLLARRGKIDQALDLIDQIRPALGVTGALQLGVTALSQNVVPPKPEQIQRVEKWFERGLREEPDSLAVQMKLADLHSVERNWPEVEKVYRSVLKRPDLPDEVRAGVLNNMAFIIAMQGKDKDEAMRYITEAVNIYGPQTDMLDTRGIVHLSRNEVEQAVADLTDSVITSDPQPIKFVHLAMAQTKAGDLPAARRSLERAKELKFNTDDLSPLEKSQFQAMVKQLGVTI